MPDAFAHEVERVAQPGALAAPQALRRLPRTEDQAAARAALLDPRESPVQRIEIEKKRIARF
jgi:hypothetical protein